MKHRFTVEVELPYGVTPADMREYIEEAVGCWRGRMDPEDSLFHLNGSSVVAREVGVVREPAKGVGPAVSHTPGPWTINTDRHHYHGGPGCIWGPQGPGYGVICELPSYGNLADHKLLVAAPELLAVCKKIDEIDCCDGYELNEVGHRILWDALNMARSVIAKVEDRQ